MITELKSCKSAVNLRVINLMKAPFCGSERS